MVQRREVRNFQFLNQYPVEHGWTQGAPLARHEDQEVDLIPVPYLIRSPLPEVYHQFFYEGSLWNVYGKAPKTESRSIAVLAPIPTDQIYNQTTGRRDAPYRIAIETRTPFPGRPYLSDELFGYFPNARHIWMQRIEFCGTAADKAWMIELFQSLSCTDQLLSTVNFRDGPLGSRPLHKKKQSLEILPDTKEGAAASRIIEYESRAAVYSEKT